MTNENFKNLWSKIKQKTRYKVSFDSEKLIDECAKEIKERMPSIKPPKVVAEKAKLDLTYEDWVDASLTNVRSYVNSWRQIPVPDVLSWLQSKTFLTKSTLFQIIKKSDRWRELLRNPQQFMDEALSIINYILVWYMVEGVEYIKSWEYYDQFMFEEHDIIWYLQDNMFPATKSLYDHVVVDSNTIEKPFLDDLESLESVEFYLKLPWWFKIETPLWTYNPDRAVVMNNDEKIYFVVETKWSLLLEDRRWNENRKIDCWHKHFDIIEEVDFLEAVSVKDLEVWKEIFN